MIRKLLIFIAPGFCTKLRKNYRAILFGTYKKLLLSQF